MILLRFYDRKVLLLAEFTTFHSSGAVQCLDIASRKIYFFILYFKIEYRGFETHNIQPKPTASHICVFDQTHMKLSVQNYLLV